MDTSTFHALATRMRDEADVFEGRGFSHGAEMARSYAADLEEAIRNFELEELSLEAAASESGFRYDTLQRKVSSGEIPNAGTRGSPRVRRCDLPYKGGRGGPKLVTGQGPDLAEEILARRMS